MTTLRVAVLAGWAAAGIGMSAAELTRDQWRADLAFLAKELPQRHKNLFHTLPRAEFERMVAQLSADIPKLSDVEIRGRITRLVAAARDGHTFANLASDRYYDLIFGQFPEGLMVIGGAKVYDAIGARLLSIDGTPAGEVRKRLSEFVSAENQYATAAYSTYVRNAAAMRAAGITHSMESAEFRLEKGGREFTLAAIARDQKKERTPEWAPGANDRPAFERRASEFYWFEYRAEAKTLYIQYNSCQEMRTLPFQKFTSQVLEAATRETPEKLIVDLRNNGGGNSEVINPLLQAMAANSALRPRGGVYVLIGPGTFSSGMLAAVELRNRFQAMLAGEPTGERPNGYGDVRVFRLPNSGIAVQYSTKKFSVAEGDPEALEPELRIPLTAADYFAGRDAVLDAVLRLPASMQGNYRDVIARDPHCASAYLALFRMNADPKVLQAGVAAKPQAAELRMALAGYFLERKNYREAHAVLAGDSQSAGVAYEQARVNVAEGKYQEATDAFRKSYHMEPENLRGLWGVAEVYLKQRKVEEALRVLDEEAETEPGNAEIPRLAGNVAGNAGKLDTEIVELQKAISRLELRSADTFEIRLELSEVYRRTGKPAEAVRAFQAGCLAMSSTLQAMGGNFLGMLMGPLAGRYEQLLKGAPNDPVLMHDLAYILTVSGRDSDRAVSLAKRSRELLPNVEEVGDNLGMIHASRKEWQEALGVFRGLVAKSPEKAVLHYHLALAQRGSGDRDGAVRELKEALRLGPTADDKREIEALLAK